MWIDKPEEQEDQSQSSPFENPTIGAGAGGGATLQTSTGTTGNPSSLSPAPQGQAQKPATIQDYFKASKTQGEALGSQVSNQLGAVKQQKEQEIGQSATNALGDVSKNTVGFDEGLVSQAVKDPTKVAGNESDYSKFMQQWDASYKGPDAFESTDHYNTAAKAAQDAAQKAEQIKTTGGRQQLLQDEFKVYGQGNKGLDEALLQQSSAFAGLDNQAKELRSLQDYLKSKSQDVSGKVKEAKATTEQTKQKTQDALLGQQGAVKQFESDLETRTATERANADKMMQDLQSSITNNKPLSDDQLKMMGINRDQYNQLVMQSLRAAESKQNLPASSNPNVVSAQVMPNQPTANISNIKDYLSFNNPNAQITRENVATESDRAKDAALSKLTGRSKLLNGATGRGKLVDFANDKALQSYLDSINADQATRDAAEQKRKDEIAAQEAEALAASQAKTDKREMTQDIIGNTALPGAKFMTDQIMNVLEKDKLGKSAVEHVDQNITRPIADWLKNPSGEIKDLGKDIKDVVTNPGKEAEKVVNKISKSIKKAFCFDGSTLIDMADGSKKPIREIQLGDKTRGGSVESVRQSYTAYGTRYNYKNVLVTGSHAVKEDKWIRVASSQYAIPVIGDGIVYSLVTPTHRIFVDGIMFADEHETDQYESLTMEQSLAVLNQPSKVVLQVI